MVFSKTRALIRTLATNRVERASGRGRGVGGFNIFLKITDSV